MTTTDIQLADEVVPSAPKREAGRTLTPVPRAKRPFPWWSPALTALAAVVAILHHWVPFAPLGHAHTATAILGAIGAVAAAIWAEDRMYGWMLRRHIALRVIVAFLTPIAGFIAFVPLAFVLGLLGSIAGDQGTTVLLSFVAMLWFCSASVGSLLVVVIDGVIGPLLHDFGSRVRLAVLGLLTLTAALAISVYGLGRAIADTDLGEAKIPSAALELLRMSQIADGVAIAFVLAVALLTLPAILSATGKIAEGVMERLHPLSVGFDHVAEGDLGVRVEEKGSRDFVRISQGFNRMTAVLSETVGDLDSRNRELTEINDATRRFVPFEFLKLLRRETIRQVQPGDQVQLELSILFCEVRGFKPLAEQLGPAATFRFVNRYLAFMGPEIHAKGGFINDFFGDGIMALFHTGARDAVDAAMGMLRAVERFNGELIQENASPIQVGIGVHTGRLMLGTIGGEQRLDCTVIGDAANLAYSVEGMTKVYGARLLITEDTLRRIADHERYVLRELDRVRPGGKHEPITVFEILDPDLDADKLRTRAAFERAIQAYREADFETATNLFGACIRQAPDDIAAALYAERCERHAPNGGSSGP